MTHSNGLAQFAPVAALLLAAALIAGGTVLGGIRHALRCKPSRCRCPLLVLWITGKALNGHVYTDATFFRGHNKVTGNPTGHTPPFQKLPGWKRRALRCAPLLLPSALLASWMLTVTTLGAVAAGWAALQYTARGRLLARRVLGAARLPRLPGRLRHPLAMFSRAQDAAMAMSGAVGVSSAAAERGLTWHRDYANAEPGEVVVTWHPPRGFEATAGQKSAVERVLSDRIGFAMTAAWDMSAERPVMTMTRTRTMPRLVLLADVLEKLEALPEHMTGIGLTDSGSLESWNWNIENPHGLLNAGSRHGKTETMMGMVAQVLRKGGRVTYVDVKRVSIQGMKGTPGLTLIDNPRDMPAMWLAIEQWGKELDQRIDDRAEDPTLGFARHLLVIEEVNQFSEMCDEFWENWPVEDEDYHGTILWKPKNGKRTPPIWRVVKHGVWEGAFAKMNVLLAGQNIEYRTVAGVRNSIGMRLLGGYQPQNWKALVGTSPVPPAPPVRGRWCMVNGSAQTWIQAFVADLDPNTSAAIWRDYARAGRRLDGSLPPGAEDRPGSVTEVAGPFAVTGDGIVCRAGNGWSEARTRGEGTEPVTDLSTPQGLLDIVRAFLLPDGTDGEQKKLAAALRMDRHRSGRGELPAGLAFPEPVLTEGQTEKFIPSEVAEFNAARRGGRWSVSRASVVKAEAPPVMPGGIPAGGVPEEDRPSAPAGDLDSGLLIEAAELVISFRRASASMLNRKLRVPFAQAEALMGELEARDIIGPDAEGGFRVLIRPDDLDDVLGRLRETADA